MYVIEMAKESTYEEYRDDGRKFNFTCNISQLFLLRAIPFYSIRILLQSQFCMFARVPFRRSNSYVG